MGAACKAAAAVLDAGGGALAATAAAIRVLEDSPLTNAAHGANLTATGAVECDASVMDGGGAFGAVAAAPGIRNPVDAAALLAEESSLPLSCGRVRPLMLAGEGARSWASSRGLRVAQGGADAAALHVTEEALRQWKRYSDIVSRAEADGAEVEAGHRRKRRRTSGSGRASGAEGDVLNDTVGCVVVDAEGRVAAGVSSGGIALKTPGRVGEAAVFGAGCWAQNAGAEGGKAVACSVTGVGERIMHGMVARECARAATAGPEPGGIGAALSSACGGVLSSTVVAGAPPRECGVLCVTAQRHAARQDDRGGGEARVQVELAAAHCVSQSLAVAYLQQGPGGRRTAGAMVLRRSPAAAPERVHALDFGACWPA
jgi:taspase (threonine aspartase 1)